MKSWQDVKLPTLQSAQSGWAIRRGLGYALTMAVLRYCIVVAAFNHYGQFEAVARIFDFWNWDKWRALHIK